MNRLQINDPHPEHVFVADVDIDFAHEAQQAVVTNPEQRQAGRHCADTVAVAHVAAEDVCSHQQAPRRVNAEGAEDLGAI